MSAQVSEELRALVGALGGDDADAAAIARTCSCVPGALARLDRLVADAGVAPVADGARALARRNGRADVRGILRLLLVYLADRPASRGGWGR